MKIQDMFEKKITREIKGVIKVGQKDDENVYQELDEYVVTAELEKYMERFFDAYSRRITGRTDNMGVWISGFFGSGKSHFLKILSYILSGRTVENDAGKKRKAVSFFTQGVKVKDGGLKNKIAKIAPSITISNAKKYTFVTPNDIGAGSQTRGMFLFDIVTAEKHCCQQLYMTP